MGGPVRDVVHGGPGLTSVAVGTAHRVVPTGDGRHVGHADLFREAVDGLVGEDPPQG